MKRFYLLAMVLLFPYFIFGQINLTASKAQYNISDSPNQNGVYPVELNWTSTIKTNFISIQRSENSNNNFIEIAEIDGNKNSFIDLNIKSIPNKKYYYQIYFYNSKKLIENKSNIAEGWGALTYEKYFKTFDKVVINSHKRLSLMNKKNNLDKLGKEQINGIRTGTLNYKTSIKINGLSGYVEMVYQNYSDDNIWKLTGNMDTEANINGNGQMYGSVLIKGMYPGTIYYNNVIIKNSKAGGGIYGVQPEGLARKELQYTITLE